MLHFTQWLESTDLSVWIRESPSLWVFPFILIVHAWGMGFLAGANVALDLRILGFAPGVPLSGLAKFHPVMWFGFTINAISGTLLLTGYPSKALTNPVFFIKMGCIAAGMVLMNRIRTKVLLSGNTSPGNGKSLAVLSLFVWAGAIVAPFSGVHVYVLDVGRYMLDESFREFVRWLSTTTLAHIMNGRWEWPIAESLHFIGLTLVMGTIGVFDLRLLGVGRQIPLSALHRLIPWGIGGYFLNMLTGICFLTASGNQYVYNPAFQLKILSMAIAGVNVLFFYTAMFKTVRTLGPGENAPWPARIVGGVSLACWISVIACGRLLTFFRPPEHWCPWC